MKQAVGILLFCSMIFLVSCIGINADISLNQNGSGTIELEYTISKLMDSLGRLDGNERWPPIPVARADFERTLARLPEIKMLSFSSKENAKDIVISVKLEFSSLAGLLAFLDSGGAKSSFTQGEKRLALTLNEGGGIKNPSLDQTLKALCEGYLVKMSMTLPGEGNLLITDIQGNPISIAGSESSTKGKKLFFSFPAYEVLSADRGIKVEFQW